MQADHALHSVILKRPPAWHVGTDRCASTSMLTLCLHTCHEKWWKSAVYIHCNIHVASAVLSMPWEEAALLLTKQTCISTAHTTNKSLASYTPSSLCNYLVGFMPLPQQLPLCLSLQQPHCISVLSSVSHVVMGRRFWEGHGQMDNRGMPRSEVLDKHMPLRQARPHGPPVLQQHLCTYICAARRRAVSYPTLRR